MLICWFAVLKAKEYYSHGSNHKTTWCGDSRITQYWNTHDRCCGCLHTIEDWVCPSLFSPNTANLHRGKTSYHSLWTSTVYIAPPALTSSLSRYFLSGFFPCSPREYIKPKLNTNTPPISHRNYRSDHIFPTWMELLNSFWVHNSALTRCIQRRLVFSISEALFQ